MLHTVNNNVPGDAVDDMHRRHDTHITGCGISPVNIKTIREGRVGFECLTFEVQGIVDHFATEFGDNYVYCMMT